jgi:hypothetical protein
MGYFSYDPQMHKSLPYPMVAALERHEEPDHKISNRYDNAIDRARMVLVGAGKME